MASNPCGFLSVILYFEIDTQKEFENIRNKYSLDIDTRQWSRKRKQLRKDLQNLGNNKNNGKNGEKERYLQYFSSGNFESLGEEKSSHRFLRCESCQVNHTAVFLLRRKNTAMQPQPQQQQQQQPQPQPQRQQPQQQRQQPQQQRQQPQQQRQQPQPQPQRQQPQQQRQQPQPQRVPQQPHPRQQVQQADTPRKVWKKFIEKTPESITQEDVTTVVDQVLKPVSELTHKAEHSEIFFTKLLGKRKLSNHKWLSKKAKKEYTKQVNEEMREENEGVDFMRLYTGRQSENEWAKQRKKDLITKKNKKKQHHGNLQKYQYNQQQLRDEMVGRNGLYATVNWSKLARDVALKNSKGKPPANGGQVSAFLLPC